MASATDAPRACGPFAGGFPLAAVVLAAALVAAAPAVPQRLGANAGLAPLARVAAVGSAAPTEARVSGLERPAAPRTGWDSRVSLGWSLLTERNGLAADYQDLRSQVRLTTPDLGRAGLRLHVDLRAREGWDEFYPGATNPYQSRRQVRSAYAQIPAAGGVLQLGRHQPDLRVASAWAADGLTWVRRGNRWSMGLTGGWQVPFWQPDSPWSRRQVQAGAEVAWRPGRPWELQAGLLRDEDRFGAGRWRSVGVGRWRGHGGWESQASAEVDPGRRQWLGAQARTGWRGTGGRSLALGYRLRVPSAWPVTGTAAPPAPVVMDSVWYGGRIHDVSLSASLPLGAATQLTGSVQATQGARRLRREQLSLRHRGLPAWSRGSATLSLADSWSRWRQLEQLTLSLGSPLGRRCSYAIGATATASRWEPDRNPTWRVRVEPTLGLRGMAGGGVGWELHVEEEMDEFQHLRTRMAAGLTWTHQERHGAP